MQTVSTFAMFAHCFDAPGVVNFGFLASGIFLTIFTGRQHNSMLCKYRVLAMAKASVRLSVCVRHTLRPYENGAIQDHETITVRSAMDSDKRFCEGFLQNRKADSGHQMRGVGKIGDFQPVSRRISETVQHRATVTIDH